MPRLEHRTASAAMLDVLVYAWRLEPEAAAVLLDVQWQMLCVCADKECQCDVCLALLAVFEEAVCIASTQTFAIAHEISGSDSAQHSSVSVIGWACDAARVVNVETKHTLALGDAARKQARDFRTARGVVDLAAYEGHGLERSREAQGMVYTHAPRKTSAVGGRLGRGWHCQALNLDASCVVSPALDNTNMFCDGMMAMEGNRHRTKQRNLCTLLFCGAGIKDSVVLPMHFTPPIRSREAQLETMCWYDRKSDKFKIRVYKHGGEPHHLCRHVHVETVRGKYTCRREDPPVRRHQKDGVFFSLWPWSVRELARGRCPVSEREWGVCTELVGDALLQRALNVLSKEKIAAIALLYNPTRAASIIDFFARRGGVVRLDADEHMQLRVECDAFWFSTIMECRSGLEQIGDDVVAFLLAVWRAATGDSRSAASAHLAAQRLLQWHRCALADTGGGAGMCKVLEPFSVSVRQTLVLDMLTTLANVMHKRGSFFNARMRSDDDEKTRDLNHLEERVLDLELEARGLLVRTHPLGYRRLVLSDDLCLDPFSGCEQAWKEILALRERLVRADGAGSNSTLLRGFKHFLVHSDTRCTDTRVHARLIDDKAALCHMLSPARVFLRQVLNACGPSRAAGKRSRPEPVSSV